ncbi:hypothetical protein GUITHDRAFT_112348 [Guillardia theta CCMP2712]|uniref:Uncharacterized protein n=1 Tax=Guillardia theta (strain CCMP2712) TaxID=905079 RepID=L1IZG4_GUITC|nr:hypothetical protein GUITHDRAFT_112348 [Guillardia theta CCMP2712]EKX41641.1 hypothetical protein GUITHDRAFT_112348 [Guillardia theta CCMP2712]|eukprot:XP_005828621.1 hypothetical protein GUITHDRAFT_112348 [Guillardia theta CCMP2712]
MRSCSWLHLVLIGAAARSCLQDPMLRGGAAALIGHRARVAMRGGYQDMMYTDKTFSPEDFTALFSLQDNDLISLCHACGINPFGMTSTEMIHALQNVEGIYKEFLSEALEEIRTGRPADCYLNNTGMEDEAGMQPVEVMQVINEAPRFENLRKGFFDPPQQGIPTYRSALNPVPRNLKSPVNQDEKLDIDQLEVKNPPKRARKDAQPARGKGRGRGGARVGQTRKGAGGGRAGGGEENDGGGVDEEGGDEGGAAVEGAEGRAGAMGKTKSSARMEMPPRFCQFPKGCPELPYWGYIDDGVPRFCLKHRHDHHIDVRSPPRFKYMGIAPNGTRVFSLRNIPVAEDPDNPEDALRLMRHFDDDHLCDLCGANGLVQMAYEFPFLLWKWDTRRVQHEVWMKEVGRMPSPPPPETFDFNPDLFPKGPYYTPSDVEWKRFEGTQEGVDLRTNKDVEDAEELYAILEEERELAEKETEEEKQKFVDEFIARSIANQRALGLLGNKTREGSRKSKKGDANDIFKMDSG